MKCPTCGANLQIEDEKCPFCGNPNPFAMKHQQDMRYYRQEFQKTKQEVERKTSFFTAFTVKITMIAVLLVLVIGMAILIEEAPYHIWKYQVHKDIQNNGEIYAAQMDEYEQSGNWIGLYSFYDEKNLYHDDTFREYNVIYYAVFDYRCVLNDVMSYSEESEFSNADVIAPRIAEQLDSFYKCVYRTSYHSASYDSSYTPKHQEAMKHLREDMEAVLMAYCHLTEEEVVSLPDYSMTKKGALLKEGLLREEAVGNTTEDTYQTKRE